MSGLGRLSLEQCDKSSRQPVRLLANSIDDKGALALAESLKQNTTLTELDLGGK